MTSSIFHAKISCEATKGASLQSPECSTDMQIRLNGKDRDVANGMSVAQLLEELEVRPERVAVLVNQGIVKKPSYESTTLREGDVVEVLTVMAGGWRKSNDGI